MRKFFLLFLLLPAFIQWAGAQLCKPEITVLNGVAVNIGPVDRTGDGISDVMGVEMLLSDFLIGAKSPCNNGTLTLTLTKSFQFTPGNSTKVFFDPTELGAQAVKIWAVDTDGNTDYVETYVLVQDNENWESQPPRPTGCDPDLVPPTIVMHNGLSSTFIPNGSGTATIHLSSAQMPRRFSDNCDQAAGARPRIDKSWQSTGSPSQKAILTFNCSDEPGVAVVEMWMKDAAGNYGWTSSYVINHEGLANDCNNAIEKGCNPDQIPPSLFVYNGLAVNLQTPGAREVFVDEFIQKVTDNCGAVSDARIRRSTGSSMPPTTTSVTFDCVSLGTQPVEIWIADQAGNWIMVETYVYVDDNTNGCGNEPRPNGREGKPWPEWKEELGKGW